MARRRQRDQTIWFPWERRGSLVRRIGLARAQPLAAAVMMAAFVLFLGARERRRSGIRSTLATLAEVHAAIDAYRADHDKKCPAALADLRAEGYLPGLGNAVTSGNPGGVAQTPPGAGARSAATPVDAWGRPLRLTCPGRKDPEGYDLVSDGPDGEMGALSRVE
jgi:general secretion pathway protein G